MCKQMFCGGKSRHEVLFISIYSAIAWTSYTKLSTFHALSTIAIEFLYNLTCNNIYRPKRKSGYTLAQPALCTSHNPSNIHSEVPKLHFEIGIFTIMCAQIDQIVIAVCSYNA